MPSAVRKCTVPERATGAHAGPDPQTAAPTAAFDSPVDWSQTARDRPEILRLVTKPHAFGRPKMHRSGAGDRRPRRAGPPNGSTHRGVRFARRLVTNRTRSPRNPAVGDQTACLRPSEHAPFRRG